MTRRNRGVHALAVASALVIAWGCSNEAAPVVETAKSYAKVSGKVTIKGQPAKAGKVTFDLANAHPLAGSARTADVRGDGAYELEAPVGKNSVIVAGTGDPSVDGSYNSTTRAVKPGSNTIDLDLPLGEE
jgi:hypothetical protein